MALLTGRHYSSSSTALLLLRTQVLERAIRAKKYIIAHKLKSLVLLARVRTSVPYLNSK